MGKLRELALDVTPLRTSREFRLLWGADGITAAGSQLTRVAAAFQIYDLTGSTLAVGLLGLIAMFPLFFGSIIGGAVADHFERRRILLLTELGGLLCTLALAANAASTNPQAWVIYVVFFLTTACYSIGVPASRSAVQMLVEREQIPSATALEAVLGSTAAPHRSRHRRSSHRAGRSRVDLPRRRCDVRPLDQLASRDAPDRRNGRRRREPPRDR